MLIEQIYIISSINCQLIVPQGTPTNCVSVKHNYPDRDTLTDNNIARKFIVL